MYFVFIKFLSPPFYRILFTKQCHGHIFSSVHDLSVTYYQLLIRCTYPFLFGIGEVSKRFWVISTLNVTDL